MTRYLTLRTLEAAILTAIIAGLGFGGAFGLIATAVQQTPSMRQEPLQEADICPGGRVMWRAVGGVAMGVTQ